MGVLEGVLVAERRVEHGTPGGFARRLAWRARGRTALAAVVAAVFVYGPFQVSALRGDSRLLLVCLVVASLAGGLARHWWGAARAASVGATSERRVARELRALKPVALLHSVDLRAGGDADHLLLGPWVVTVETKTGTGPVRYTDGKLYVGNRPLKGDPLAQCRRQARAARDEVGSFCDAIVCVVDMENRPFTQNHVTVCSLRDLPGVIRSLSTRVSDSAALTHAHRLAPRTSTLHDVAPDQPKNQRTATSQSVSRASAPPSARPFPGRGPSSRAYATEVRDKTLRNDALNEAQLGDVPVSGKFRPRRRPSR